MGDAVLAENQFNDPPPAGHQFVMVTIRAKYDGPEEPASFVWQINLKAVKASAVVYLESDPGCGVMPQNTSSAPEVFIGGNITANACWAVSIDDIASLTMFGEASLSFDSQPVFFELEPVDSQSNRTDETPTEPGIVPRDDAGDGEGG